MMAPMVTATLDLPPNGLQGANGGELVTDKLYSSMVVPPLLEEKTILWGIFSMLHVLSRSVTSFFGV
jgi:hypothetical protein